MSTSIGTAVAPNNTAIISGVSAEFNLGSIVGLGGAVANLTGQSATASVGALDPNDMTLGISGQSFSASVGSISVVDMQVGLTGLSTSFSVGSVNIFAYGDIDTGQNNSYSDIATGSNGSYSNVATGSNNSYTDVAA